MPKTNSPGIEKLPSGRWRAKVRKKGWPPQSKTFSSKTNAVRWKRETETDMERDVFEDDDRAKRTPLRDVLAAYLEKRVPSLKGHQPAAEVRAWMKTDLAARMIGRIKPADITDWMDERLESVGPKTVRNELLRLSAVFSWAEKGLHLTLSHPIKGKVIMPSLGDDAQRDRRLEPGEEERLLEAAAEDKSPWIGPLIVLALEAGARRGELVKLTWRDVDLSARKIMLRKTKNGRDRWPALSRRAAETLEALPRSLKGSVFPVHKDTVTSVFRRVCEAAEIDGLRWHDLRHEAISRFFEAGLTTEQVMTMSGHITYSQLKRYTHLRTDDLAAKLDRAAA